LQVLPVTLTVALGPLVTIVCRMIQVTDDQRDSLSLAQAVRGSLCVLMFLSLFLSTRLHPLKHRLLRPLLFLAVYAASTSFASPYPYENLVFAVKLVFVMLVFASAFHLAREGVSGERWLTLCSWMVLLTMMTCMGEGLATGRTIDAYPSRFATAGVIGQPYMASCLMLSALPVLIRRSFTSGSAVVGLVLLFTSLFFTMCRNALIAAVVATGTTLVINLRTLRSRGPWRRTLLLMGVFILSGSIGFCAAPGADLIERFKDLAPSAGAGSGRYVFWQISLEHILHRPRPIQLTGEGMGSIRNVIERGYGVPLEAHNDWLDLVNAFGLCGLIGVSWWCLELARFVWSLRGRQDGALSGAWAALMVLGLISMGTGGGFDPSWALTYAALGFWAGDHVWERQQGLTASD
jgi:hypothetical protein